MEGLRQVLQSPEPSGLKLCHRAQCAPRRTRKEPMFDWRQWKEHPEQSRIRQYLFQIHLWTGAAAALYVLLLSISGSLIVFRNEFSHWFSLEAIVRFHTNLLSGPVGRTINGIGALSLLVLCLTGAIIWWPGVKHWRRSLTVNWQAHFARINWDLHSALGFWGWVWLLVWAISGVYFAFPRLVNVLFFVDPNDRFSDQGLFWLSRLHFGRFGWAIESVWALLGLVPGILAFTGVFICCRRVLFKLPSNPKSEPIRKSA
jgi:uncharacterized iron-regulated membrane protein